MELPKEPSKEGLRLERSAILLYGFPKTGKSTFATEIPGGLFIATEPRHAHLKLRKVDCDSFEGWEKIARLLYQDGKQTVQYLIFDTVEGFYRLLGDYVIRKYGGDPNSLDPAKLNSLNMGPLAYGKGIALVNSRLMSMIHGLKKAGYGLCFISHAKIQPMKDSEQVRIIPDLGTSAREALLGFVDFQLYTEVGYTANKEGQAVKEYLLRTQPAIEYEAGSSMERGRQLSDPLPQEWNRLKDEVNQ